MAWFSKQFKRNVWQSLRAKFWLREILSWEKSQILAVKWQVRKFPVVKILIFTISKLIIDFTCHTALQNREKRLIKSRWKIRQNFQKKVLDLMKYGIIYHIYLLINFGYLSQRDTQEGFLHRRPKLFRAPKWKPKISFCGRIYGNLSSFCAIQASFTMYYNFWQRKLRFFELRWNQRIIDRYTELSTLRNGRIWL